MATAAPPLLSDLAGLLLRRPPSLQELVARLGCAEDYAWFTELVRRLFPEEAEAALAAPDVGAKLENFARLFQERHFPLYLPPSSSSSPTRGRTRPSPGCAGASPSSSWASATTACTRCGTATGRASRPWRCWPKPPDAYYDEPCGLAHRLAGVRSPAHPPADPGADTPGRHTHLRTLTEAQSAETELPGSGPGRRLGAFRDRQLLPRFTTTKTGTTTAFPTPGRRKSSPEGTTEWRKADQLINAVCGLADWLEEDLPARFAAAAGLHPAPAAPTRPTTGGKR